MATGVELATGYLSLVVSGKDIMPGVKREMAGVEREADRTGKVAGKKLGSGLSSGVKSFAAGFATAFAVDKVVGFFSDSIKAASDAEQAIGGVQAVFGRYAKSITSAADTAATSLGLSKTTYMELTTVLAAGLKNKGIKDFAAQSQNLVKIGADLAAQFGGSTKEAVDALGSAMRGETDPIERYGVSMNQSAISAEALRMGLVKSSVDMYKVRAAQISAELAQRKYTEAVKEHGIKSNEALAAKAAVIRSEGALKKALGGSKVVLDDNQKAQAALSLVTRQTADATGAFGRESDTLAGKQARASAQWENLKQTIGEKFLPVMTNVFGFISDHIPLIVGLGSAIFAVGAVVLVTSAATKAWTAMQAVAKAATIVWTGVQWALNAALSANPIGLVILVVAALVAGIVIAYQRSETFRNIVTGAFKAIQDAVRTMWGVAKQMLTFLVDKFLTVAGAIVHAAAWAFGWVPGLGGKLKEAAAKFDTFRAEVNRSLAAINDEPVNIDVKFRNYVTKTGKATSNTSLVYSKGDGYGIGDGPGLEVNPRFPSSRTMSSGFKSGLHAQIGASGSKLMALLEDYQKTTGGVAGVGPSGARGWQSMWAAVKAALPGATLNSAFRPGAITATGNRSYHGMGRAVDLGPATMRTFNVVKALFPNATELIFSPAGMQQLWHGKPHMYGGVTRANHWDHVHLAMQAGGLVPGSGSGDKVRTMLEPGEYVVSRPAVRAAGVAALDNLNQGGGGRTVIIQGDVYEASMFDRVMRAVEARDRAAAFRAGVLA